jgi:hypothetical protein
MTVFEKGGVGNRRAGKGKKFIFPRPCNSS